MAENVISVAFNSEYTDNETNGIQGNTLYSTRYVPVAGVGWRSIDWQLTGQTDRQSELN